MGHTVELSATVFSPMHQAVEVYQRLAALLAGEAPRGLLPPAPRGYVALRIRQLAGGAAGCTRRGCQQRELQPTRQLPLGCDSGPQVHPCVVWCRYRGHLCDGLHVEWRRRMAGSRMDARPADRRCAAVLPVCRLPGGAPVCLATLQVSEHCSGVCQQYLTMSCLRCSSA